MRAMKSFNHGGHGVSRRKMKQSGVPWIGEVPYDWALLHVKRLFNIGRGRVIAATELEDEGFPVYSSQTLNDGCIGYLKTYDFDCSQLTWTTDGANAGTVFLREGKHNCTNICGTLQPKNNTNNLNFIRYALYHTAHYNRRYDINGFKIMNNEMAVIKFALPLIPEQTAIANFLDDKCSKIDALVENEEKMILELSEYKNQLAVHYTTKGLNKTKLKQSNIDWIGEIPEHWQVLPLYAVFKDHKSKNTGMKENNLLSLSYGNIVRKDINTDEGLLPESFEGYNIVEQGDIVLRLTDLQNDQRSLRTGLVRERGIITSAYITIRNLINANSDYLRYLLHSADICKIFYNLGFGIRQNLKFSELKRIDLVLPPKKEQDEIVSFLNKKFDTVDKSISVKKQKITQLKDYKKSLIYEYVTGKKEL